MAYKHLPRFALVVLWIALSAVSLLVPSQPPHFPLTSLISQIQYGYHIAALNSTSQSIICDVDPNGAKQTGSIGLPSCVDMSEASFGTVTSAYTVGGLFASLQAGSLIERWGKKGTAVRSAGVLSLGTAAVAFGSSLWVLVLGRILVGMSCGIATVLVPLYLSSVAPPAIAGSIGIITQISVNSGIVAAQGFSLPLSSPGTGNWRYVSIISLALAVVQILTAPLMPESGKKTSTSPVYDVEDTEDEERAPLSGEIGDNPPRRRAEESASSLSFWEVLRSKDVSIRRPLYTLALVMLFQQLSGINAVMYYSTSILNAVNPASAKTVSLFVTLVNLFMTFPIVYLIDRLGRRTLLLSSLAAMCVSTAVIGWSINNDHFWLASVFIVLFVAGFAFGCGPVPFVLCGEMPAEEAKSATASVAVGVNWTANLLVGIGFLPLRDYLAGPDGSSGSGTVFYVFTATTGVGAVVLSRLLH
ncbi:hypothetical protein JCM10207_007182 [Rhodosporidiobolus poonsookiae]